ncbi:glycosyltransferase [Scytonema sp. UIC 10036]|uniref:glycosyltransferase n=1 Tax=Scytonema sp. UIC 10036 TaxID=2304196 RepID=UPI0012DA30ED|nr:glycosyltransferase [Scytonema sp. UIC 10036]MUG96559.1 glycosyltransferase [Scytonema sp. UIC 10036]
MTQSIAFPFNEASRVLMVSMRNLKFHVSRSAGYEFEDIICSCDTVDLFSPTFNPALFKVTNALANSAAKIFKNGKLFHFLVNYQFEVKKEYELFFIFCQSPQDILVLNSLKGWRDKCRYAVCWLDELWAKDIDSWRAQLELLKDFDCVFMNFSSSIDRVHDIVQRPCYSIPYGVDTVKFCPYPADLYRCIDVLNIGRRSKVTHNALLELADREKLFYIYDTIKDLYMSDYGYHRSLYTNFIKRSRYTIVNKAKFDLTGKTNPQEEVDPRFFEGAAGGTIMLGVAPKCKDFNKYFDWSDPVIEIPFDCFSIAGVIGELDTQPEYQDKIRKNNIFNSLLTHDWVYRWEAILATLGLDSTPKIGKRKAHLQNLAEIARTSPDSCHQTRLLLAQ